MLRLAFVLAVCTVLGFAPGRAAANACDPAGSYPGSGTRYYVSPTGTAGGAGSVADPKSLSWVTNHLNPGDTACLLEGTRDYTERLITHDAGSPTDRITYMNVPDETPTISDIGTCIVIKSSWVTVSGITCDGGDIENPSVSLGASIWPAAERAILSGNTFRNVSNAGILVDGQYNQILDNTVENVKVMEGIWIKGEYNLIEGNAVRNAGHAAIQMRDASYNVVRGNDLDNPWHRVLSVSEQTSLNETTEYNVIEGNRVRGGGRDEQSTKATQDALTVRTHDTIVRRNLVYDNAITAIRLVVRAVERERADHNRIYHNVVVDNDEEGLLILDPDGLDAGDNAVVNNIFLDNSSVLAGQVEVAVDLDQSGLDGNHFVNNDILNGAAGSDVISVAGLTETKVAEYDNAYSEFAGNVEDSPNFADRAHAQFFLTDTSPLRNAGAFLTATAATGPACSGQTIQLEAGGAGFFSAGIEDAHGEIVAGDEIQIEGVPGTFEITAIDHASDQLTLDATVSCANGAGVSLPWEGSAPDIGAYEGAVTRLQVTSDPDDDGYVTESSPGSGTGGSAVPDHTNQPLGLRVGDTSDSTERRSVVSFDTAAIPDGAEVVHALLVLTRGGVAGSFAHSDLVVDVKNGSFGAEALEPGDFEAAADGVAIGRVPQVDVAEMGLDEVFQVDLNAAAPHINKTGKTQFRLRFETPDIDGNRDVLGLYPGDSYNWKPKLRVYYR